MYMYTAPQKPNNKIYISSTIKLYKFEKAPVPEEHEEKLQMIDALMTFGVSISQYEKAYKMPNITA